MDGNQRWAKEKQLIGKEGYTKGLNNIKEIVEVCIKQKIKYLTLFALSSENINRSSVNTIFEILLNTYKKFLAEFKNKKEVKIQIIGEKDNLPINILNVLSNLENATKGNEKILLNIAFNYGLDKELVSIVNQTLKDHIGNDQPISFKSIKKNMYLSNIPDPDLLIRTGGFKRLSNFILLNLSYTELYFTDSMWPDFSEKELLKIIHDYKKIERKYGL